jgi:transposase
LKPRKYSSEQTSTSTPAWLIERSLSQAMDLLPSSSIEHQWTGQGAIQTHHRRGLLAYYDYPIFTDPLEETNNKIKTMQQQAYGF